MTVSTNPSVANGYTDLSGSQVAAGATGVAGVTADGEVVGSAGYKIALPQFANAATYIPFGDSRVANGNQDSGSATVDASRGAHNHLQTLMAGRMVQLRNAGVTSNTSTQMLARLDADVLAYQPGWCLMEGPVNDVIATLSGVSVDTAYTTMVANVKAIRARCAAAGVQFATSVISPWTNTGGTGGTWTGAQKGLHSKYNRWVKAWCQANNIPCADVYSSNASASTGLFVTNGAYDTQGHYSDYGAFLAGRAWFRALDGFIPSADFMTTVPYDYDNMIYDGGGGWTVGAAMPATWTATGTSITGQVNSVVARTDGIQGSLIQLSGTASAQGANMITTRASVDYLGTTWSASSAAFGVGRRMLANDGNNYRVVTAGTTGASQPAWNSSIGATTVDNTVTWERVENFNVGDIVYSEVEVFVLSVSGGNLGVGIQSVFSPAGPGGNLTTMNVNDQATRCAPYPVGYYVIRSRPYTFAAGQAGVTANVRAYLDNGVTATIGVGRVAVRHFTTV